MATNTTLDTDPEYQLLLQSPPHPPRAVFVYSSKRCVLAVTTDTQTVQRGCVEAGMALIITSLAVSFIVVMRG